MWIDDFTMAAEEKKQEEVRNQEDGQLFLATVSTVTSNGVSLVFDGTSTASQKRYKQLNTGVSLSGGDRVVVMRYSGSYVVLGKIAFVNSGSGDYVEKTGDDMTGDLTMLGHTVIGKDTTHGQGDTVSADTWSTAPFTLMDKNGNLIGLVTATFQADGRLGFRVHAQRDVSGADIFNALGLYIDPTGGLSVEVSDASAWRDAIGAVDEAGDTMTGELVIENTGPGITLKSSKMDNSASGIDQNRFATFRVYDKNGNYIAYLQAAQRTSGRTEVVLGARRNNNGADLSNTVALYANKDGTVEVDMSHPAAWRSALDIAPNHVTATGSPKSTSQLSGGVGTLLSIDLPAGIWLIYGAVSFNTNSTGIREIAISTGSSAPIGYRVSANAVNSNPTDLSLTLPVVVSSLTTYNLITYHNSGSQLGITGVLEAVRIGPAS